MKQRRRSESVGAKPYPRFIFSNAVTHSLRPTTEVVMPSVKHWHLRVPELFLELTQLVESCVKVIPESKAEPKRPPNKIRSKGQKHGPMRMQDIVKIERAIIPKQTHNFIICSSVITKEQSVKRYVRRGEIGTKSK